MKLIKCVKKLELWLVNALKFLPTLNFVAIKKLLWFFCVVYGQHKRRVVY